MEKDFARWHVEKSIIDRRKDAPFFHVREIWMCALGANVGDEQDGSKTEFLRPVIIFRQFNAKIFWAIPLTKTIKNSPYYFCFSFTPTAKSSAILSQMRLLDAKRLRYKMGNISDEDFEDLKQKLKPLIA